MRKTLLACSILSLLTPAYGDVGENHVELEAMVIKLEKSKPLSALAFNDSKKASDGIINQQTLRHKSATLGDALSGELGIHSNPFGSGSSAPVVRGQEGVRVKILQNGLEATDMSTLSPDHVIGVDSLLATQVELVRGASTLLHGNASGAGVINVADNRIPTALPDSPISGEALLRFNSNNDEKVATSALSFKLADNWVLRTEGLTRKANPYEVPAIKFGETLDYLPDSQNRSHVGALGISYIHDKGYLGASYALRQDKYGLIGHNHKFDHCSGHILDPHKNTPARGYLLAYPHLMDDSDMINSHFHCGSDHDHDPAHSHENPYGHQHDHSQAGPWVQMQSKSTRLQGALYQPFWGVDNVQLALSYDDYHHEEHDHGKHIKDPAFGQVFVKGNTAYYDKQGVNGKLIFAHTPSQYLQGVWGISYQRHKNSALIPSLQEKAPNRQPLVANTHVQKGIFALEQLTLGDVKLEAGVRYETAKVPVHYDMQKIAQQKSTDQWLAQADPDLSTYQKHAVSYALSGLWDINPKLRLDASYSHLERIPTPMELYYHGKNLATNSFLYGNKNLDKEISDNYEMGVSFSGDKWRYKASAYRSGFNNYIHAENLYKSGNLYQRRYTQSKAKIYGLEGELSYAFTPNHELSVFGDYTKGRLYGFAPVYGNKIYGDPIISYEDPATCGIERDDPDYEAFCCDEDYPVIGIDTVYRPARHVPRLSPMRLGVRFNSELSDKISTHVEYSKVFAQHDVSVATIVRTTADSDRLVVREVPEDVTHGYHLLNAGVNFYHRVGAVDYTLSLKGNNLLNEKIYVHNSFLPYVPQMGRNFSLALQLQF